MIRHQHHRTGGIALWVLLVLPILLFAAGTAIYAGFIAISAMQATSTTDAAALSATRTLVSDEVLRGRLYSNIAGINDPPNPTLLTRATNSAIEIGKYNRVKAKQITFVANPTNAESGDIVFGFTDHFAYNADLLPADLTPGPNYVTNVRGINSTRVVLRRTGANAFPLFGSLPVNIVQGATAILDGDVVGFRPLFDTQFLPIMPFGITSGTWTGPVIANSPDNVIYDRITNTFSAGSDGLPEVTIRIVEEPPMGYTVAPVDDANTFPLTIGTVTPAAVTNQVTAGVSNPEYNTFVTNTGGPFELTGGPSATLLIPANKYYDPSEHANLVTALSSLIPNGTISPGLQRVWPLVTGAPVGNATATTFVAARVVSVTPSVVLASDGMMGTAPVNVIDIVLQPTMLESPTTVTDFARRTNVSGPNPYIAKVRLTK